jgi:mannose-1-phosphate guanylyltransferase
VLVNTHHLEGQVKRYVEGPGREYGVSIRLFHEEKLLGSAGTVRAASGFVEGEESFFILYADNLTEVNLRRMASWHAHHADILTMGLFLAPWPERCGVAILDSTDRVVEFEEKPSSPRSPWAAAGIYVARAGIIETIEEASKLRSPAEETLDLGRHVFPLLARRGEIHGYLIAEFLMDIGTPESYAEAQDRIRVKDRRRGGGQSRGSPRTSA